VGLGGPGGQSQIDRISYATSSLLAAIESDELIESAGGRLRSTEARLSPPVTGRSCTAMARSPQGALMRFPDRKSVIKWYHSPEYQQLTDVRGVAMDARFSLVDGLPS
jgi:uncharacterized protein (DUF1330 family)